MIFKKRNIFFAAVGAVLMYFFDPVTGPARRSAFARKAKSAYEENVEPVRAA